MNIMNYTDVAEGTVGNLELKLLDSKAGTLVLACLASGAYALINFESNLEKAGMFRTLFERVDVKELIRHIDLTEIMIAKAKDDI